MISTKGRYALRVMLDLADHNTGEYIPLKDIAQRQEISVKYLENILASLSRANLVDAIRGQRRRLPPLPRPRGIRRRGDHPSGRGQPGHSLLSEGGEKRL